MTFPRPTPTRLEELPIRVLEVHIDDTPRCRHCHLPAFLLGRCGCDDYAPQAHTQVLIYTNARATRAANRPAR
jgi:hypothetical protein